MLLKRLLNQILNADIRDMLKKDVPDLAGLFDGVPENSAGGADGISGTSGTSDARGDSVYRQDVSDEDVFLHTEAKQAMEIARLLYRNRHLRNGDSLAAAARLLDEVEKCFHHDPSQHALSSAQVSDTQTCPASTQTHDVQTQTHDVETQTHHAHTQTDHAETWAWIQYHRGEVTWYRAFLDPSHTSDMIESALAAYQNALCVFSRERHPLPWAETLQSIALVTTDRVHGNRSDNFRKAIRLMEQTLDVFTRESHPVEWANTMINLGSAWGQLPDDDTAENMEKSIDCLTKALSVHSRETNPVTWATLQVNLGTAFQHRIRGDAEDNLEQTIRLYRNATDVFSLDAFPERWAMLNCNIGNAFMRRVRGSRDQNITEAIDCFQVALAVTSERIPPFHHAMVRVNLAGAYLKSRNADQHAGAAIDACEQALAICRDNYPVEEAMIHFMLANALRVDPAQDHRSRHLTAATHYKTALKIMDPVSMPSAGLQHSIALAETLLELHDVAGAAEALTAAMSAFELLYRQNITLESRRSVIERGAPAYFLAAYCAALENNPRKACEYLERGRTRILADRLAIDKVVMDGIRSEWHDEFTRLSESIRELEYRMQRQGMSPPHFLNTASELKQARRTLDDLISTIRNAHPEFLRNTATFDDIWKMIPDPQTALVETCVTTHGTAVLIVLHPSFTDSAVHHLVFPSFNLTSLEESARNYTTHYAVFKASEKNKQAIASFENTLLQTVQPIYDAIFRGVDEILDRHAIRHLILAPHRFLHILPLHLMRSTLHEKPAFLFDKYTVSYTPGATALVHIAGSAPVAAEPDAASRQCAKLMAVTNPTGDLLYADAETESVSAFFDNSVILSGAEASVEQVIAHSAEAEYLHFACHGRCDLEHPEQTGLVLAGSGETTVRASINCAVADPGQPLPAAERAIFFHPEPESATRQDGTLLSLIDICHRLDLRRASLVFLSACESGRVSVAGAADEVVGLPSAFLQAGARAVVTSLWLVDDAHSREFVERFYRYHVSANLSAAAALQQAQRDMMALSFSPYYWAGFIVTGMESRIVRYIDQK